MLGEWSMLVGGAMGVALRLWVCQVGVAKVVGVSGGSGFKVMGVRWEWL